MEKNFSELDETTRGELLAALLSEDNPLKLLHVYERETKSRVITRTVNVFIFPDIAGRIEYAIPLINQMLDQTDQVKFWAFISPIWLSNIFEKYNVKCPSSVYEFGQFYLEIIKYKELSIDICVGWSLAGVIAIEVARLAALEGNETQMLAADAIPYSSTGPKYDPVQTREKLFTPFINVLKEKLSNNAKELFSDLSVDTISSESSSAKDALELLSINLANYINLQLDTDASRETPLLTEKDQNELVKYLWLCQIILVNKKAYEEYQPDKITTSGPKEALSRLELYFSSITMIRFGGRHNLDNTMGWKLFFKGPARSSPDSGYGSTPKSSPEESMSSPISTAITKPVVYFTDGGHFTMFPDAVFTKNLKKSIIRKQSHFIGKTRSHSEAGFFNKKHDTPHPPKSALPVGSRKTFP